MPGGAGQAGEDESPGLAIFIQVDNVAVCISEAHRLGGATYWGPRTFDDGMTTACIADPGGNGILLIAPGSSGEPYASRRPVLADRWSREIYAADPERLLTFSNELFGWSSGTLNE
jgi:predicted enzyme related to lactoylglutathione lyase